MLLPKSMVRYTGHFLINCLSEGDLTDPLSIAKLGTWHGETSHCCVATLHHLRKQTSIFFFFPQATDDLRKMNRPYAIPHTYNTCRCRLVPGAMPPFNYTGHLHHHKLAKIGLRGGVAIAIELKPTAINQCGKSSPFNWLS